MLHLVTDVDHHVIVFRPSDGRQSTRRCIAYPKRVRLWKVHPHLTHLRHRHAQEFSQANGLGHCFGFVNLIAHNQNGHLGIEQHFGGTLNLRGIGPHAHACVEVALLNDLGAGALVGVVGVPIQIRRAMGWRPSGFESVAHCFWNHGCAACHPRVFGEWLHHLVLVGNFFKIVATRHA